MSRFVRFGLFGVLALGVCLLTNSVTRSADDDDKEDIDAAKKLADPVKKLLAAVQSGKDVAKAAEDLNKKGDLKHIMWAGFKSRDKGGVGVGEKAGAIKPDGVEAKIISMSKKPMSGAQLEKESADLVKMAQVAQAIGDIAELNTPKKNDPKDPKKTVAAWTKYTKLQKDSAKALEDAVKANDADKVLDATKNLYSSCTNCHSIFRD